MLSDRARRQIERLLDQADEAMARREWPAVCEITRAVLSMEPENADALTYLAAAERAMGGRDAPGDRSPDAPALPNPPPQGGRGQDVGPSAFCDGRYEVRRFLGEGGKKRVYLAYDTKLDREVAFALIKTEGLDEQGLLRIRREAQAMGRLGDHPHIVSVHDIGDENGQPYLVSQLMPAGTSRG